MRFFTVLLGAIIAPSALAEPVMIAPERILAGLSGDEYAQLNWNKDAYQDLAALVLSESRETVELYIAISDPDTGALQAVVVNPALFPYDPSRFAEMNYDMHFGNEWGVVLSASSVESGLTMTISLTEAADDAIKIADITTYRTEAETNVAKNVCQVVYEGLFLPDMAGKAVITLADGEVVEYPAGPAPSVTEWRYTDWPKPCFP
ncbi:hypothetical protein [Yoonia sp. 2307UL14-13]|uniref:hypothetical protein n=1 Tax=Yoonia sp. 2307UL14-13 TaxID=3126506 RepID=UPI003095E0D6